jgi:hypothetical protein
MLLAIDRNGSLEHQADVMRELLIALLDIANCFA